MREEKEGLRIKSATVVSEPNAFDSFTSSKLEERPADKAPVKAVESFPSFQELQSQRSDDISTSSKQESVTGDENNFTKTVLETKHEVRIILVLKISFVILTTLFICFSWILCKASRMQR